MNNNIPQTQPQLLQIYQTKITSLNPNLSPAIQGSDLYFKGQATAQVGANIVQDTQLLANNVFAASSSGVYLDKHAGALGMTPRMGALPSQAVVTLNEGTGGTTATADYTILPGTLMTDATTNNQYQTISTIAIAMGEIITTVSFTVISVALGGATASAPGDSLDFTSPLVISGTQTISSCLIPISGMTVGSDVENDNQFALRIFNYSQNPRGGGGVGDYYDWCFLGSPNVTGATIVTTGIIGNQNIVFPIIIEGNSNPNFYIDGTISNGFAETVAPINRSAPPEDILAVQNYINGVKPVQSNPEVLTVATYEIVGTDDIIWGDGTYFDVYVSLTPGLTLSTQLTLPDLPVSGPGYITVQQLIQREFRRAMISAPLGGTTINIYGQTPVANQYIPIVDISDTIMQGLSNSGNIQGDFTSAILGLNILFFPTGAANPTPDYIKVPSLNSSNLFQISGGTWNALLVYDIDVSIINVYDISLIAPH